MSAQMMIQEKTSTSRVRS